MLLDCMAGVCPNTGVLLGDKGLQLPPSLGGSFGFPCTSDTLDQGTGPYQGEKIWGSLSCTCCPRAVAQMALVTLRCQQPPNATKSRHPGSPPTQDWGSGNGELPVLVGLGLAPRGGQPCAAFLGAAGWACGCGQQENLSESISVSGL